MQIPFSKFTFALVIVGVLVFGALGLFIHSIYAGTSGNQYTTTIVATSLSTTTLSTTLPNGQTTVTLVVQPAISQSLTTTTEVIGGNTFTVTQTITNQTTCTIFVNGTNNC